MLVCTVAYVLYTRERRAPVELPLQAPAQTPTPMPAATPEPGAIPALTPVPRPAAAATPEPPVPLSQVDRRALPREVTLLKPVDFVLLSQGQPIGSARAAAGVRVSLVGVVNDSEIEVQMGDSRQTIPSSSTDIDARVRVILRSLGQTNPVPGP